MIKKIFTIAALAFVGLSNKASAQYTKLLDFANHELVKKKLIDIYSNYQDTFLASNYRINDGEESVITQNGFLNITWQKEMDAFDILIATPVIPEPKRCLTAKEIADKMIEKRYCTYFNKNREHKIITNQDEEILNIYKTNKS